MQVCVKEYFVPEAPNVMSRSDIAQFILDVAVEGKYKRTNVAIAT